MEDRYRYGYGSEYDDLSDDNSEGEDNGKVDGLSNYDIEMAGSLDGEQEGNLNMADYSNYGSSVDLGRLTDEQRNLYDNAFHASKDSNL